MLNLGFNELMVIVLLTIVVVGPEDIPKMMRYLGRQYGKIMRASEELRRAFMIEAERGEAEARAEELKKRREEAKKRAEEMRARALAARAASDATGAAGPTDSEPVVPRAVGLPTDPPPPPETLAALAAAGGAPPEPAPEPPPSAPAAPADGSAP